MLRSLRNLEDEVERQGRTIRAPPERDIEEKIRRGREMKECAEDAKDQVVNGSASSTYGGRE